METQIMTLFTRTPVHVGAGNSVGAIDSPVMRERHTSIPIVPGSSLKGVLADFWTEDLENGGSKKLFRGEETDAAWLFGQQSDDNPGAGALLIGEARVLAFPVRSAKGSFAWITCPLALSRFARDAGVDLQIPAEIGEDECLASETLTLEGKVILEEYCFKNKGQSEVWQNLANLTEDAVWKNLKERFAVVNDEIFSYFVEHACEVVTRIRIDDETGVVAAGALFNQEQVPSETMFYACIGAQRQKKKTENGERKTEEGEVGEENSPEPRDAGAALAALKEKLDDSGNVIQVGGDETTGLGYCTVSLLKGGE